MKIGIVGNGFVGNALYQAFKDKVVTKVYDVRTEKCLNTFDDTINCDIVFVCLPTPMAEDGQCDLSEVNKFFDKIEPRNGNALYVIKSTVPIGTTELLSRKRGDLRIVHNPEFLTAVNSVEDFQNAQRHIIGGAQESCHQLKDFYNKIFPYTPVQIVKSKESETIKYFANSFLASKVALFNVLYDICDHFGLDYESVRDGVCSDQRIGDSHSKVPGPDGLRGFGGYCFPKDINALIHTLRHESIDPSVFSTIWTYNRRVRGVD
jgi:UDPglucose 6-dehydrogenase